MQRSRQSLWSSGTAMLLYRVFVLLKLNFCMSGRITCLVSILFVLRSSCQNYGSLSNCRLFKTIFNSTIFGITTILTEEFGTTLLHVFFIGMAMLFQATTKVFGAVVMKMIQTAAKPLTVCRFLGISTVLHA